MARGREGIKGRGRGRGGGVGRDRERVWGEDVGRECRGKEKAGEGEALGWQM